MNLTPSQRRLRDDIQAALRRGERVVLTGLPGAGRRTLAQAALRSLEPSAAPTLVGWSPTRSSTRDDRRPLDRHAVLVEVPPDATPEDCAGLLRWVERREDAGLRTVFTAVAAPQMTDLRAIMVPALPAEEAAALLAPTAAAASQARETAAVTAADPDHLAIARALDGLPGLLTVARRRLQVSTAGRLLRQLAAGLCTFGPEAEGFGAPLDPLLRALPPEALQALGLLERLVGPVDAGLLLAALDRLEPRPGVEAALERLAQAGLLRAAIVDGHPRIALPGLVKHRLRRCGLADHAPSPERVAAVLLAEAERAATRLDAPDAAEALRRFRLDGGHLIQVARQELERGDANRASRMLVAFGPAVERGHLVHDLLGVLTLVDEHHAPPADSLRTDLQLLRADLERQLHGPQAAQRALASAVVGPVSSEQELRLRLLRARVAMAAGCPDQAAACLPPPGDVDGVDAGRVENLRALIALVTGRLDEARQHTETSLARLRTTGSGWAVADTLLTRASTSVRGHFHRDARLDLLEAVACYERLGDPIGLSRARSLLGLVSLHLGHVQEARQHLEESAGLARTLGQPLREATALLYLAVLEHDSGCLDAADRLFDEIVPQLRLLSRRGEAFALAHRGLVALERRLLHDAHHDIERAVHLLEQTEDHESAQVFRLFLVPDLDPGPAPEARAVAAVLGTHGIERLALHSVTVRLAVRVRRAAEAHRRELEAGHASSLAPSSPALSGAGDDALHVTRDGRWFRLPDGSTGDLSRRVALHRILAALVEARLAVPGAASLTVDDLVSRGWPGQRLLARAGRDRVYAAIRTLRRMGLDGWIVTDARGYALRRGAPLRIVATLA